MKIMINHTDKMMKKLSKALSKGDEFECVKCEWVWVGRIENPKCCPHCKSYDWDKEKIK